MTESLRDALSEQFDKVEQSAAAQQEPVEVPSASENPPPPAETAPSVEEKPGRTAGRARDDSGRLLPGAAKRDSAAEGKPTATPSPAQAATPPAAELPKPLARPSTLKKELWPVWDKLTKGEALTAAEARQKAEWILQRDSDYAKGVSTYKAEADNAKPILEALTPFMASLQANNVQPAQWISNLGNAHQRLVYGSPHEKVQMFAQMAQQYGVDLGQMFVKGNDGQVYLNPQLTQAPQQRPQQQHQAPQPDVRQTVQEILADERALAEVAAMEANTEKYPHFKEVKQTMRGLLLGSVPGVTNYDTAYQAAIRLPEHAALYEAQQQQQREADEAARREATQRTAAAARRNAFSPRSATPTAAAAGANGKKGLREALSENFDAVAAGRV